MREVHYGQLEENDDIKERINTYFANIKKLAGSLLPSMTDLFP